jgi:CDP-diacylglycerol--serine O-phosphatidyltransferase
MRVHPKYFVPNGFTALSMVFGLASVVTSSLGFSNELTVAGSGVEQFRLAAWLICWGVLLDKLDGSAARLMGASSEFGVQFDSFADFVVFGIAPAALIYTRLATLPAEYHVNTVLLLVGAGFFVVATAVRLARFNISEPPGGDKVFYGIPTTICGAFVASAYLVWDIHNLDMALLKSFSGLLLFSGFAMLSNVKLPKLKPRKNKAFNLFQAFNIAAVYVLVAMRLLPEYMFALILLYVFIGTSWAFLHPNEIIPPEPSDEGADEDPAAA